MKKIGILVLAVAFVTMSFVKPTPIVKDVYSVDAVTEKRKTLYINMLKENKNKISDVAKVAIT